MNARRPPSRAQHRARTTARLRRMRRRHRGTSALSIEFGVLRALALHAADPCAPLDLKPLPWPSERELLERILGSQL